MTSLFLYQSYEDLRAELGKCYFWTKRTYRGEKPARRPPSSCSSELNGRSSACAAQGQRRHIIE
eukprot:scaffold6281_cov48-Attheya_sp.AAC.4